MRRDGDAADRDERSTTRHQPSSGSPSPHALPASGHGHRRRLPPDRSPRRRHEARIEEVLDPVTAAQRLRHADIAGQHRTEREDDEHDRHRWRRVVHVAVPCPMPRAGRVPAAESCFRASSGAGVPRRAAPRGTSGTRAGTCRWPSAAT